MYDGLGALSCPFKMALKWMPFKICNSSPAQGHSHMLVDIDCLSKAWGGGLLSPKSYVDPGCACRTSKIWLSLYQFLPNFPPINIPFSKEKHPILTKLGAFYNIWPKIHPIFWIWDVSSLMNPPPSLYQILRKSTPKGRHIYVYHVNVRTPGVTRPHFLCQSYSQ